MPFRFSITGEVDPFALFKDQGEEDLGFWWASQFNQQYDDLLAQLASDQPRDPPESWWEKWGTALTIGMIPIMLNFAEIAIQENATGFSAVAIDWNRVIGEATNWADTYSFGMVKDVNAISQANLQEQLRLFYNNQLSLKDMKANLLPIFGPVRAAAIATTETTRGFERGQDILEEHLKQSGVLTDRQWFTEPGACAICAPNEGKFRDRDGWTTSGAPAHPNCRCWTVLAQRV